jgi:hypothetical protein
MNAYTIMCVTVFFMTFVCELPAHIQLNFVWKLLNRKSARKYTFWFRSIMTEVTWTILTGTLNMEFWLHAHDNDRILWMFKTYVNYVYKVVFFRGYKNPCGGGVEYLHRDPASRKRRRNGTKQAAP